MPLMVTVLVDPFPCDTETLVAEEMPPLPDTKLRNSSMLYGFPPQQDVVTGVILPVSIPPVLRAIAALTMSAISSGESHGLDLPHLFEEGLYPCVYHDLYNQGEPPILS